MGDTAAGAAGAMALIRDECRDLTERTLCCGPSYSRLAIPLDLLFPTSLFQLRLALPRCAQ